MGGKSGGGGGGAGSLNSSISNSVLTGATSSSLSQQQQQLQAKYIKSKRSQTRYSNLQHVGHSGGMGMHDSSSYLHLNSLWSIWYGVLLTLFQGYLAMHGAYRFLGCSLVPWKIEPVAELNLQIVLSGVVFILLPVFFTSAVFKVGNLANDGIKLATGAKERRCSLAPHDGLEEEARGGTLRALWTHGGPTAAFVHILIALCLLLPRLLLEARIIENGLLPKEQIWATELDFVVMNRRNMMALSVVGRTTPYQNLTGASVEHDDDDYYNDTMFTAIGGGGGGVYGGGISNSLFELKRGNNGGYGGNGGRKPAKTTAISKTNAGAAAAGAIGKTRYFEVPDLINRDIEAEQEVEEEEEQEKVDDDDGGGIIMPNFVASNEFVAKTTTTTTTRATTAAATTGNNRSKLNEANWQKLGTLGKANSLLPFTSEASTTTTLATTTTTHKPTTTTQRAETTTAATRILTTTAATESGSVTTTKQHHHQQQHHHNVHHGSHNGHKTARKHHKHRKGQNQQPRRHHVASHEQVMEGSNELSLSPPTVPLDEFPGGAGIDETTTRDSNIHRVRPEVLPEVSIPATPDSSNSKIIAIKAQQQKQKRRIVKRMTAGVEIEPEFLVGDGSSEFLARSNEEESLSDDDEELLDDAEFQAAVTPPPTSATPSADYVHLDGFAGMLQLFFGIDKPIDVTVFVQPPSAEFVNLLCALLVWSVRYPAVFWNSTKTFASVFSLQMIVAALDVVFGYVGVSNLYKLQIYAEAMPVHQPGLILNASVTLALYLLSTALVLASSMVLYLYGHGRLATRMRERSLITLKESGTWIYFAHCASLCFVLALAVVKAPLLNDLSATYKNNLHCPTFLAALIGVVHLLLWIVLWLCLSIKRRWHFKLPPLDAYGGLINKASAQPLLMASGQRAGSIPSSSGNSSTSTSTSTTVNGGGGALEAKPDVSSTELAMGMGMGVAAQEDIYWPKLTPSSPKLKVTFNEVTSTSDDVLLIGDQEQTDGKRHSSRGAAVCFASAAGEIDDGEYATLRAATAATVVGITMGSVKGVGVSGGGGGSLAKLRGSGGGGSKMLHLSEYDELPPPPPSQQQQLHRHQHHHQHHISDYANLSGLGGISDDNISEEGKLLACVRDDSITYASTRDLEPPQPPPPPPPLPAKGAPLPAPPAVQPHSSFGRAPQAMPEIMQLSSTSPEHHHQAQHQPLQQHLVSPLAPVTVTVHTNEAHIASSSTPRCLRRADSGVPNEALTPRSDTTSTTESTTSPPERAPSESSSGVHSGEERDVEVVIRPRASCKPPPKPPQPPIQEEPYGRCTNMRMSSFNADPNNQSINSATLPLQRCAPEQKFDYTAHCSTMPLPAGCHSQQHVGGGNGGGGAGGVGYASTSAMQQSMTASLGGGAPPPPAQACVSSFKTPIIHYANAAVALGGTQPHTTLPNGVRYSNPHFLRRLPHVSKAAESPYGHLGYGAGHHTFSKLAHEPLQTHSLAHTVIPEDRDSANYSMASDQDCGLYVTAQLH